MITTDSDLDAYENLQADEMGEGHAPPSPTPDGCFLCLACRLVGKFDTDFTSVRGKMFSFDNGNVSGNDNAAFKDEEMDHRLQDVTHEGNCDHHGEPCDIQSVLNSSDVTCSDDNEVESDLESLDVPVMCKDVLSEPPNDIRKSPSIVVEFIDDETLEAMSRPPTSDLQTPHAESSEGEILGSVRDTEDANETIQTEDKGVSEDDCDPCPLATGGDPNESILDRPLSNEPPDDVLKADVICSREPLAVTETDEDSQSDEDDELPDIQECDETEIAQDESVDSEYHSAVLGTPESAETPREEVNIEPSDDDMSPEQKNCFLEFEEVCVKLEHHNPNGPELVKSENAVIDPYQDIDSSSSSDEGVTLDGLKKRFKELMESKTEAKPLDAAIVTTDIEEEEAVMIDETAVPNMLEVPEDSELLLTEECATATSSSGNEKEEEEENGSLSREDFVVMESSGEAGIFLDKHSPGVDITPLSLSEDSPTQDDVGVSESLDISLDEEQCSGLLSKELDNVVSGDLEENPDHVAAVEANEKCREWINSTPSCGDDDEIVDAEGFEYENDVNVEDEAFEDEPKKGKSVFKKAKAFGAKLCSCEREPATESPAGFSDEPNDATSEISSEILSNHETDSNKCQCGSKDESSPGEDEHCLGHKIESANDEVVKSASNLTEYSTEVESEEIEVEFAKRDSVKVEKEEVIVVEEMVEPVEDTEPVVEAPVAEAPVEEAPVEIEAQVELEAPVEEAPVEIEAPVEEAQVEEAQVELEAQAEKAPVELEAQVGLEAQVEIAAQVENTSVELETAKETELEPVEVDIAVTDEAVLMEESSEEVSVPLITPSVEVSEKCEEWIKSSPTLEEEVEVEIQDNEEQEALSDKANDVPDETTKIVIKEAKPKKSILKKVKKFGSKIFSFDKDGGSQETTSTTITSVPEETSISVNGITDHTVDESEIIINGLDAELKSPLEIDDSVSPNDTVCIDTSEVKTFEPLVYKHVTADCEESLPFIAVLSGLSNDSPMVKKQVTDQQLWSTVASAADDKAETDSGYSPSTADQGGHHGFEKHAISAVIQS